ncbi:hypothetical protein [Ciceribacter sp. L1K22]|uniref:hypothetical protein n=1 Tax=Ciceribacter sp. L1K22 TaxID=2820275 RepID=UPI001ABE9CBB|nr:hypothetical protein [Ciceribacter sp. L1K22]MBO3761216.1 hypothetical protein [Ciceribacter sp. L1K22]
MLFGKSLFQSVVDRLSAERPPEFETEDIAPRRRGRGSGVSASFLATAPQVEDEAEEHLLHHNPYQDAIVAGERPAAAVEIADTPPPMPPHLRRITEKEVREDLGISPGDDAARLTVLRREFARLNHPDRVPTRYRTQATVRMMLANALIDDALRQIPPSAAVYSAARRRQS